MIRRILTYLMSSGIAVAVDFIIFTIAEHLGAGIPLATAIGRAVSCIVNFTINRRTVFQSDGNLPVQFLKYIALVIFSGSISAFTVTKLQKLLDIEPVIVKAFVESLLFVFNYFVQHFLIFRKPKQENRAETEISENGGMHS